MRHGYWHLEQNRTDESSPELHTAEVPCHHSLYQHFWTTYRSPHISERVCNDSHLELSDDKQLDNYFSAVPPIHLYKSFIWVQRVVCSTAGTTSLTSVLLWHSAVFRGIWDLPPRLPWNRPLMLVPW